MNKYWTLVAGWILTGNLLAGNARGDDYKPAPDSMLTEWGSKVTPQNTWQEYPRPALVRKDWKNLNGLWKYQITPINVANAPEAWAGDILVPFCLESALSGVKKRLSPNDALWYHRTFDAQKVPDGQKLLLNFEAVDYESTVWVNGKEVARHTGGNLPFSIDITNAVKAGENTITLRVTDATDTAYQLSGKQAFEPHGIWYTPVSGIWQTVWLEMVPATHVVSAHMTPTVSGKIAIQLRTAENSKARAKVTASLAGKEVASVTGPADDITLQIPEPKLWSPDSPTLYDLNITVGSDTVTSYVGVRETTVQKDADGYPRLLLNGKPLFQWGTLDQGWWPDGLLTPPSDAGMKSDIEFLKAAGFNTLRKHIKVEPRRYYTHCDQIGILVWQDQVSSGKKKENDKKSGRSPEGTGLKPNPVDADWPQAAHKQYMAELEGMMQLLHDHPSIVMWVPFNEAWGQHKTVEVGKWMVAADPSRQVNIASGGNWWPVGHIVDRHHYPDPDFPTHFDNARFDGYVKVVGEFGGHGFPVEGHLWNAKARNFGYGDLPKDKNEWLERYKTSITKLAELKKQGVAAGIYTQTTDVEGEINGLITYDRKVQKAMPAELAEINKAAGLVP